MRYLAIGFRPGLAIRVNAISAGPMRTLAGAGITDARAMFEFQQRHAPLRRGVTHRGSRRRRALSAVRPRPASPAKSIIVDSGYNIIAMPQPERLKLDPQAEGG